jgi:hypothetical protein
MPGFTDYPTLFGKSRSGYLSKAAPDFDTAAEILGIMDMVRTSDAENPDLEASPRIIGLIKRLKGLFEQNAGMYRREQPRGFTPMQPIYSTGAFGTTAEHHGIYVGYGVVLEVSAETCASNLRERPRSQFLQQCFGVTRLSEFGKSVVSGQQQYHRILVDADNNEVLARFDRAIALLEEHRAGWDYDILRHNCQHATNMVVHNKDKMAGLVSLRSMFSWLTAGYGCKMPGEERERAPVRTVLDS